jgi:hypothetical protein
MSETVADRLLDRLATEWELQAQNGPGVATPPAG